MHHQRSRTIGDILIVDDDPTIVEMLTEILLFEGYQVRSGRNGREALAAIMAKRPALVLLDLQMPEMNGAEVIDALAETPFADLPMQSSRRHRRRLSGWWGEAMWRV